MPIGSKFSKPAAPAKAAPGKKSRYAGIKASQPRPPLPHVGTYRFRIDLCEETRNPGNGNESYKVHATIVGIAVENQEVQENKFHRIGDSVNAIFLINNAAGASRAKSFVMAAAGFDEEEAFDAFDPDGEFIDATVGAKNDYSAKQLTIVGRLVDAEVTRGNATPDGNDYYREFAWAPVPDEEQESVLSAVNQLAAVA